MALVVEDPPPEIEKKLGSEYHFVWPFAKNFNGPYTSDKFDRFLHHFSEFRVEKQDRFDG